MIPRYQLAVAPRIAPASLLRAASSLFTSSTSRLADLASDLRQQFSASECVLTDSGTSALVLALRLMVPENAVIGLPSYGCVDITSAVRFAGVRARLYDIDPRTMSPDLDSVNRLLKRGVQALLVAHYYGYPADVRGVRALASSWGVPILEDAAQAAGGSIDGARLGSLGDLSILSFGRGKGLFGGRGGALLIRSPASSSRIPSRQSLGARRGVGEWCAAVGQWALGRPEVYALPASIPALRLGEMVYRPARQPRALSGAAASLARSALATESSEREARVRKSAVLRALVEDADQLTAIQPIDGAEPGYLRFAVVDRSGLRTSAPRLGVMPGYPRTLPEQTELAPQLMPGEPATPGADALRQSLFTLPTHSRVNRTDLVDLQNWVYQVAREKSRRPAESSFVMIEEAIYHGSDRQ